MLNSLQTFNCHINEFLVMKITNENWNEIKAMYSNFCNEIIYQYLHRMKIWSQSIKPYLFHNISNNQLLYGCGELVTVETGIQRFKDLLTSIRLHGNTSFYHKAYKKNVQIMQKLTIWKKGGGWGWGVKDIIINCQQFWFISIRFHSH